MIDIKLNQLLSSFSLALDMAEERNFHHAQRVAVAAVYLTKKMGLSKRAVADCYYGSLLHDIGTSFTKNNQLEKEQYFYHPLKGAKMVSKLPLSDEVAEAIKWHHASWDGENGFDVKGEEIPLVAQAVNLADYLDIYCQDSDKDYTDRKNTISFIKKQKGKMFSPLLIDAFMELATVEKFWLDMRYIYLCNKDIIALPENDQQISILELENIASVFADIVDSKSSFTMYHSSALKEKAVKLTSHFDWKQENARLFIIAALLHDIGKLSVPNSILDKPGRLTPKEFQVVKRHTYFTKKILSQVDGFNTIANWGANHHETLDGTGYPEKLNKAQLSREERLMSVLDIFQALTETRPYRISMNKDKAFKIMGGMADRGKICAVCVDLIKEVF